MLWKQLKTKKKIIKSNEWNYFTYTGIMSEHYIWALRWPIFINYSAKFEVESELKRIHTLSLIKHCSSQIAVIIFFASLAISSRNMLTTAKLLSLIWCLCFRGKSNLLVKSKRLLTKSGINLHVGECGLGIKQILPNNQSLAFPIKFSSSSGQYHSRKKF